MKKYIAALALLVTTAAIAGPPILWNGSDAKLINSGALIANPGASPTPSVNFGTTNTGIYGPSSTTVGVTSGGTEVGRFHANGLSLRTTSTTGALNLKALGTSLTDGINIISSGGSATYSLLGRDSGSFFLYDGSNVLFDCSGSMCGTGPSTPTFQWTVNRSNTSTSVTAQQTVAAIGIQNTDSTAANTSALNFANATANADSAIKGVHDVQGASYAGSLHFLTSSSGALVDRAVIDKDGKLALKAYSKGALNTDASGNVTYVPGSNLAANPSFEDDSTGTGWTASGGTFTTTTTAANVGSGTRSGSWDSNAAAQTLTNTSVTVTSGDGLSGQNGVASCRVKASSGTATHLIQAYDGTNVLGSATITSSTSGFVRSSVNFIFPTSGTVSLRFVSVASDEPLIYPDDCYIGLAEGFNSIMVNQIGPIESFTPTSATLSGSGTGRRWRAGDQECFDIRWVLSAGLSANPSITGFLPSGTTVDTSKITTSSGRLYLPGATAADVSSGVYTGVMQFDSAYSAITNFSGGNGQDAWTPTVPFTWANNDVITAKFCLPITGYNAEAAYRPDALPASWSGTLVGAGGGWSTSSAAYSNFSVATTSSTLTELTNTNFGTVTAESTKLPGITFTPAKAGKFQICASGTASNGTAATGWLVRLVDSSGTVINGGIAGYSATSGQNGGFTVCGHYTVSSVAAKTVELQGYAPAGTMSIAQASIEPISWSITALDQATAAPLLVGSVTSNTTGLERVERAMVTGSTCAVSSQSGSWLSTSNTHSGTGLCSLSITAGMFSSVPICTISNVSGGSSVYSQFNGSLTTTTILTKTTNAGSAADADFNIICMGPR